MDEVEIDALWAEHIGSRRLSAKDELKMLRRAQMRRTVSWRELYSLYMTSKIWRSTRWRVLKRDGNKCVKCGSEKFLHVDHIRYPEMIGYERMANLQTLCAICHQKKTSFDMFANGVGEKMRLSVEEDQHLFQVLRRVA
jgi:5-methylcytosine-specific restriction endonuclease McrA